MGSIKDISLEAKAGLLGAAYAFEQMISKSATTGSTLENFTASTGMSAVALQNLQNAMRGFNVSNQESQASLEGLNKSMLNIAMSGQSGKLMKYFGPAGIDFNITEATKQGTGAIYAMQKFQELARKVRPDVFNMLAGDMGFAPSFTKGLLRNQGPGAIDLFNNNKGYVLNDKQILALDKVKAAMLDLENMFLHLMDSFTIKHGAQGVKDLKKLLKAAFDFLEKLFTLAEKAHAFEGLDWLVGEASQGTEAVTKSVDRGTKDKAGATIGLSKELAMFSLALVNPMNALIEKIVNSHFPATAAAGNKTINHNYNTTVTGVKNPDDHAAHINRQHKTAHKSVTYNNGG